MPSNQPEVSQEACQESFTVHPSSHRSERLPAYTLNLDQTCSEVDDDLWSQAYLDPSIFDASESGQQQSSHQMHSSRDLRPKSLSMPSAVYDLINQDDSTHWTQEDINNMEQLMSVDEDPSFDHAESGDDTFAHGIEYEMNDNESDSEGGLCTPYWKMLRPFPWIRSKLICRYCELTEVNFQPISRNSAGKRLRARCNETDGENLLSNDLERRLEAKRSIEAPRARKPGPFTSSDIDFIIKIMEEKYNIDQMIAPILVRKGIDMLPVEKKRQYASKKKKDPSALMKMTSDIYATNFKQNRTKQAHHPLDNTANTGSSKDGLPLMISRLTPHDIILKEQGNQSGSYWMSLSNEQKEVILTKYTMFSHNDPQTGWYLLDSRCSNNIAAAMLSDDASDIEYAMTVLNKVYRKEYDLLTEPEKKLFYEYLAKMHGINTITRYRIYSLGSKGLPKGERTRIQEDIRMDAERFVPLTNLILETYRMVRRAS